MHHFGLTKLTAVTMNEINKIIYMAVLRLFLNNNHDDDLMSFEIDLQ